jgi:wee1-like protein kinase
MPNGKCTICHPLESPIHLDFKPKNIHVFNGVYKLKDFGHATQANGSLDIEGRIARYMPLEILNNDHTQLHKVDMNSLSMQ